MVSSLGTNCVVGTRVHCICFSYHIRPNYCIYPYKAHSQAISYSSDYSCVIISTSLKKKVYVVGLFVLRFFYGPVNPVGSC